MMMKTSSRWLRLLAAAVVVSSAAASTSSTECIPDLYADGDCDQENNKAECGYDSGDCCSCTCVDTPDNTCGRNGFDCIDPEAPCMNGDDDTIDLLENCDDVERIGNGECDMNNNNEQCGFDGGDCCECTCVAPDGGPCDPYRFYSIKNFACIDPKAPCVDDDEVTVELIENCDEPRGIGNGFCDLGNNNAICGYDGGDCCECTCVAPDDNPNAVGALADVCNPNRFYSRAYFACIDPSAPCVDDDDVTAEMIGACNIRDFGDGYCNTENNNETCGYDGGDCCECTCVPPDYEASSYSIPDEEFCSISSGTGFACIDPAAPCVDDDSVTPEMLDICDWGRVSNANCDLENNREECAWDGGDCCSCTCVDAQRIECGYAGFACIDPSAECVDDDSITVEMFDICDTLNIGDGLCDMENNREECAWDGGDCCSCTCVDAQRIECGYAGFACIDPSAECVDDDSITVEMFDICDTLNIGDGLCDRDNNREECAWDGGDCCSCTCQNPRGSSKLFCREFACVDPSAPCVDDDDITAEVVKACYIPSIGNGYCEDYNNKPECNYDGGDCCECTCVGFCGSFACIDPSAECVDDDSITVEMLDICDTLDMGDGRCDDGNNREECAWDGGDCCSCTCQNPRDSPWLCREFACVDPSAPCVDDAEPCGYEGVVLEPKLKPQGICRADGTKFEITGIEGVPIGFYVHKVNIVGSTATIMEDFEGGMSVALTPHEAVDVEVTLASTSGGPCGPLPAVRVTPVCECISPEDCDTSNTGLICCKETDVCDYFNTGACGDPHMTGFLGQKFDFTGENGQWYSLIADDNMNVNMRVTSPVADLPEITYITGLSVQTTDADDDDHGIVIEVKDPHSLKSSCPAGVSPCLADGSLRVVLDGEEALQAPGTVFLGQDVQISAVNLPGACRSFGFEKYWDRKRLENARHGRRLGEALRMSEWVLDDPTATNMNECTEYVASAELAEGGMFAHQSEHASFQIVTPKATIRLSHGRLHQIAMRDPTDQFDLPDHLTWQMNMAVDHNEVSRDAKGILGETWVPTRDSAGEPIMTGFEAIRGQQQDYLVDGALGRMDFNQDEHNI